MKGINRAAGHGRVRVGTDTGNGEHELCAARDHMFQVNAIGRFDAPIGALHGKVQSRINKEELNMMSVGYVNSQARRDIGCVK